MMKIQATRIGKLRVLAMVFVVLATSVISQGQSYQKTDTGIKTVINSVGVEIQFFSPSTVRILKWPEGEVFNKESLSVIKTPQKTAYSVNQTGDELSLKSDSLIAVLNLKTGAISFKTLNGQPLLKEKDSGVKFTDFDDAGDKTYSVAQSYVLDQDEAIYGLGILQKGKMSLRNIRLRAFFSIGKRLWLVLG